MPIHKNEHDTKELDIQPPKPMLTFQEWTSALQRQHGSLYRKCDRMFLELNERLRKNSEDTQDQLSKLQEKIYQLENKFDNKEETSINIKLINEPAEVIVQLKEENVQLNQENAQLKEEITTLKSKIHYLWELITSFFEKNISAAGENWNAFFSRNKKPVSETVAPEPEHSNTIN